MFDYLRLCELLSNYFDEELEWDICSEIDELINQDFCSQVLFNTFNRTLELCQEFETEEFEVPEEVHLQLLESLRIEISSYPAPRIKSRPRRNKRRG